MPDPTLDALAIIVSMAWPAFCPICSGVSEPAWAAAGLLEAFRLTHPFATGSWGQDGNTALGWIVPTHRVPAAASSRH